MDTYGRQWGDRTEMQVDGEVTAVKTVDGKAWRWQFISTGGREDLSPTPYKTAKAAKAAGEQWVREQRGEAERR